MRSIVGIVRIVCAAALASVILVIPAATLPAPATTALIPTAMLSLRVHNGSTVNDPVVAEVDLVCDPDAGSHPNPTAACTALRTVGGRFEDLPPRGDMCLKLHQPMTAVVEGWYGAPKRFTRTYGNGCVLRSSLAPVFDF